MSFEMMASVIKHMDASDLDALVNISQRTFLETFGMNYNAKDLNDYMETRLSRQALGAELADAQNVFFSVWDEKTDALTGYIKIIPQCCKFLDDMDEGHFEPKNSTYLERFYLLKSFQGTGIAQNAMQATLDWIKQNTESDAVHLTVFCENPRAYTFYQRFGFEHVGNTVYMVGDHADKEFLYLLKLVC
jgi:RimJ/RimL family protein N-acetyltransferase